EAVEARTFKQDYPVKKDGSYAVFLIDGTIRYKFTWSAPGYGPYSETMKLQLGVPNNRDIDLVKEGAQAGNVDAAEVQKQAKPDPAVEAYNAAAALANEGKVAEAIAKMEEAVAAKADLTAAHMALAKLYARGKEWDKAIASAKKGLEVDTDDIG